MTGFRHVPNMDSSANNADHLNQTYKVNTMKTLTKAQKVMINTVLAIAVMTPVSQAQAGLFGDIGNALDKAANTVAGETKKAVTTIGGGIASTANTVSSGAKKIAKSKEAEQMAKYLANLGIIVITK